MACGVPLTSERSGGRIEGCELQPLSRLGEDIARTAALTIDKVNGVR
jgi:hypothetical protein